MEDKQALVAQEKTGESLKRVNLYIASSVTGPGRREGSCGWVLECPDRPPSAKNPMTEAVYLGETTAHGALLWALRDALGHVRSRCALMVHTDSPYMAQALSAWLPCWEQNNFATKKGKPVADRENWKEVAILLNAAGFPAGVKLKKAHAWRNWLAWEVKKKTAEGGKCVERLNAARQQAGKEGKEIMTQKYTMVKNGKTYGDYTVCQISRMLAEGQKAVREAAAKGTEICGYTLEEAQTAENENGKKKVLAEWDAVRFRINPQAKKGAGR